PRFSDLHKYARGAGVKRTRKWSFVAQEAIRLAELQLTPIEIARRLDVDRATVQRWMAAGKLVDTRRGGARPGSIPKATPSVKPADWAATVRKDYALDATDDQLVTLAESMLGMSQDPLRTDMVRIAAANRFAALVKQLALVARAADVPGTPEVPT